MQSVLEDLTTSLLELLEQLKEISQKQNEDVFGDIFWKKQKGLSLKGYKERDSQDFWRNLNNSLLMSTMMR